MINLRSYLCRVSILTTPLKTKSIVLQRRFRALKNSDFDPLMNSVLEPLVNSNSYPLMNSTFEPLMNSILEPLMNSNSYPLKNSIFEPQVNNIIEPLMISNFEPLMNSDTKPMMNSDITPLMNGTIKPLMNSNFRVTNSILWALKIRSKTLWATLMNISLNLSTPNLFTSGYFHSSSEQRHRTFGIGHRASVLRNRGLWLSFSASEIGHK